ERVPELGGGRLGAGAAREPAAARTRAGPRRTRPPALWEGSPRRALRAQEALLVLVVAGAGQADEASRGAQPHEPQRHLPEQRAVGLEVAAVHDQEQRGEPG